MGVDKLGKANHQFRIAHGLDGRRRLAIARRALNFRPLPKQGEPFHIDADPAHRPEDFIDEHVPVAGRTQAVGEPFEFDVQRLTTRRVDHAFEHREGRAHAPKRHPHLMDALGINAGHGRHLVRQDVGETGLEYFAQRVRDGHRRREDKFLRPHRLRRRARTVQQSIAALGFGEMTDTESACGQCCRQIIDRR